MTETIAAAIEPQISAAELERARRKPPDSLHAWDYYQRGLWHDLRKTKEDVEEAGRLFRGALELDPGFSLAYTALAEHLRRKVLMGWTNEPEETRELALRAARQAVAADDRDPQAHFALGGVYTMNGEYEAAIAELEEALDLNPNMALASFTLGSAFVWAGRASEALSPLQRAIRQSPRDPRRMDFDLMIGIAYFMLEENENAVDFLKRSSRRSTGYFWPYLGLAATFAALGLMDDSRAAIKEALRIKPDLSLGMVADFLRGQHPEYNERYLGGLREAGLPE